MGREGVSVIIRTRPTASFAQDEYIIDGGRASIRLHRNTDGHNDNRKDHWDFKYDQVLHNASQQTVYSSTTEQIVSNCVEGKNGTILAYGQTGSGKTFTMIGESGNFKQRGVTPRALSQVFQEIEERPEYVYKVYISYMEIYNERIVDLLDEEKGSKSDYPIMEDSQTHTIVVKGLTKELVQDEEMALKLLFRGERNRITAEHQLNRNSNRSHSIFTVHIEKQSRLRSEHIVKSKLHLVDLAGSERLKKSIGESSDETLVVESRYINKSLSYLEQVVVALAGRNRSHIPYRQTKLTNILKDSIGGNSVTALIACVWCESVHFEETLSTLKFAQRMSQVENRIVDNVVMDPELLLKRYERQIRDLKQELMMHDSLVQRQGINYDDISPEEVTEIAQQVRSYVDAPIGEESLEVVSMKQIRECFRQFKTLILQAEASVEARLRKDYIPRSSGASRDVSESKLADTVGERNDEDGVGDIDDAHGFGVGMAPAGARPESLQSPHGDAQDDYDDAPPRSSRLLESPTPYSPKASRNRPNRDAAYQLYLERGGNAQLEDMKVKLYEVSAKMKTVRSEMVKVQDAIAEEQTKIETIRDNNSFEEKQSSEVIDEEEFLCLKSLKDLKKSFRSLRESYDSHKVTKDGIVRNIADEEQRVLSGFKSWYADYIKQSIPEDDLDDDEKFEQLEISRVSGEDPQSVAYFKAAKQQQQMDRKYGRKNVPNQRR